MKMPNIDDLIKAAKEEDWEIVDKNILNICSDPVVQEKAIKLLTNSDRNVRDLGASILGKFPLSTKIFSRAKPILRKVMVNDENPYARYRAAFALAEHGVGEYKMEIIGALIEASQDKDVGDIAKKYLARLK